MRSHSSTPSCPSCATSTAKPSARSRAASAPAIATSSSTMTIVASTAVMLGRRRARGLRVVWRSCGDAPA